EACGEVPFDDENAESERKTYHVRPQQASLESRLLELRIGRQRKMWHDSDPNPFWLPHFDCASEKKLARH
ncbi:MAG: hypothetical protein WBM24_20730, partial [Candidatus Sulfotelmatobacter sp.]